MWTSAVLDSTTAVRRQTATTLREGLSANVKLDFSETVSTVLVRTSQLSLTFVVSTPSQQMWMNVIQTPVTMPTAVISWEAFSAPVDQGTRGMELTVRVSWSRCKAPLVYSCDNKNCVCWSGFGFNCTIVGICKDQSS